MSEDDTFRKLIQRPFDEVCKAVIANNLQDYKAIETEDLLRYHGWTLDEYHAKWLQRNQSERG